jgi:hypothetical protein
VAGLALTLVLPEPAGRSLDEMATAGAVTPPLQAAEQSSAH